MPIPVIDLFAGPGGLGEGFSSPQNGQRVFKIKLSIEKDVFAHRTLELRAFVREFPVGEIPKDYYQYLRGAISREELFGRFPDEAQAAAREAWLAELGGEKTPDNIIDDRIRRALQNANRWVLIGGPPCQAYSLIGRSCRIGLVGKEKFEADPRHRLYEHYLRILAIHRPPVFVMENVKGLLSAKVREEQIFKRIMDDLKNPTAALPREWRLEEINYRLFPLATRQTNLLGEFNPEDFVVRTEGYGIPQARHRIIIVGIRSDFIREPKLLEAKPPVTVEEAIKDLPRLRSGLSKEEDSPESWRKAVQQLGVASWLQKDELNKALLTALRKIGGNLTRGGRFVLGTTMPEKYRNWFFDRKLGGVCNHETRGHIREDLHRYFFAAVFASENGRSPLLENFPAQLLPKHRSVAAALKETKFNDRFRVQIAGRQSTTIVSHIAKDGHYYIHYDPSQCRSMTVREAARLQTFPDNYFFEGGRTQQYYQVGNAVPPLLAKQIAEIVAGLFE